MHIFKATNVFIVSAFDVQLSTPIKALVKHNNILQDGFSG